MLKWSFVAVCAVLALSSTAQAGIIVDFDQERYEVQPGEDFPVQILLDADGEQLGMQSLANGLLSMGAMMTFESSNANIASTDMIVLPPELNSDGLAGPAYKTVAPGSAGASGALILSATEGYDGALLATITVTNLAPLGSEYELNLDVYRAVGDNFVRYGEFQNFDSSVGFGSATVVVVPEPTTLGMLAVCGIALVRRKRQ